jgi:hypothetical protein
MIMQHEQKDSLSCPEGKTCNVPDNKYFDAHEGQRYPKGKRIDYILYRSNNRTVVDVHTCEPRLNRITSLPEHCYSDHLAVYAHFKLRTLDRKYARVPADNCDLQQMRRPWSVSRCRTWAKTTSVK